MIAAWVVSTALLLRFAIDFSTLGPLLAVPFWGLVVLSLAVMAMNTFAGAGIRGRTRGEILDRRVRGLLLSLIPAGFLASSLGCAGLSFQGCSPFCTFIKLIWIPLTGVACVVYHVTSDRRGLAVLSLMAFVPLLPHCVCYNVANAWWIDHIHVSPDCYVWGFAVNALVVGALASGKQIAITLAINSVIIAGSMGFFVAHHYFSFPW